MISPIFTTIVIGFLAIMVYMKATTTRFNTGDDDVIENESRANAVRRKSLDDLNYIHIPVETLPFHNEDTEKTADGPRKSINSDVILRDDENNVLRMCDRKIVNFTGMSNTDLKMTYGAPNLTVLSEYDANFTELVKALDTWGTHLIERDLKDDARKVLEFAVECRSDLKSTYTGLADMYVDGFEFDKLDHITEIAGGLNSLMKEPILRALKDKADLRNLKFNE
ncbi:MAG: hypothetical protein K6E53_07455 [Lachnospiraceae bacterium]|nr:hypothetical protein [Lachnospiraceae bacterium]